MTATVLYAFLGTTIDARLTRLENALSAILKSLKLRKARYEPAES
jgi:hypothetical protein